MTTYQTIGLIYAGAGIASCLMLLWEGLKNKSLDLAYLPMTGILVWICRLMVGFLFFYSGFVKANDYIGFAYKLEEYFVVFGQEWPALKGFFDMFIPIAEPMAWFISVFEIALAFAIVLGWRMNLTAWLSLIMMVFFTFLTGWSHVTGSVTDCGCFGDALKIEPWESFLKDLILLLLLIPIFLTRKSIISVLGDKLTNWAVGISFVLSGVFSYYCHEHLPWKDYRPYKVGVDLAYCTTHIGLEGYAKCKDWDPSFLEDEISLFEGNVLMIITNKVEYAPESAAQASVALVQSLQGSGIQAIGATSSGYDALNQYEETHQINYDWMAMDETVLKTIVRSHPGYVLLQNGVIKGKWHYNDTPDKQDLQSLLN